MHEKEIKNLKDQMKNLKDMHEKEINMIMNIYMIIYAIMKK